MPRHALAGASTYKFRAIPLQLKSQFKERNMPSKKYLVGDSEFNFKEQEFKIVNALSQCEAIGKYVRQAEIKDKGFLEYVCERAFNMSFAEYFWLQGGAEVDLFKRTGKVKIDKEEFGRRVRRFFGKHQDFANLYLDFYWNDNSKVIFPDEMLAYIWIESNYGSLTAIPLSNIEEIH